jgi:hypothetical protein
VAAVAQAPPKKEEPFVMELLSGNKRDTTKFDNRAEGK